MRLFPLLLMLAFAASAVTYEVGPGKPLARIGDVPWVRIDAGDTVLIHWRPAPYQEKWVIGRTGRAGAPITVRGVPSADGQLPVIDGTNAVTAPGLDFFNQDRGVIKVGGSNVPNDLPRPSYVVIENLVVRGGRAGNAFDRGAYSANAAGIFVERGDNVIVRNCVLHDNGNGLFLGTGRDFLLEGNYIYDNGYGGGDSQHHNVYLQGLGVTVQRNRFGRLKLGSDGGGIKDRSGGLVVRYNWIEGGNRQLDLVEIGTPEVLADPRYRETWVYGNLLFEFADQRDNPQFVIYGGDGGNRAIYRKGTLYFHNNTMVSLRPDFAEWMAMLSPDERVDARNNIFHAPFAAETYVSGYDGVVELRNNWIQTGTRTTARSMIRDLGGNLTGDSPGLADPANLDFRLRAGSPAVGTAGPLAAAAASHAVTLEYVAHLQTKARVRPGQDMGALGLGPPSPAISAVTFRQTLAPNSIFNVYGIDLAERTASWAQSIADGALPVSLDGVRARIAGRDAYLSYVSPAVLTLLTPGGLPEGEAPLEVVTPYGTVSGMARIAAESPVVFTYPAGVRSYPIAFFANEATPVGPIGPPGSGVASRPARPGDVIYFYATGLGATDPAPPEGRVLTEPLPLADLSRIKVTIGGVEAAVRWAGLAFPGVHQINLSIPDGVRTGDQTLVVTAGARASQAGVTLSVQSQ